MFVRECMTQEVELADPEMSLREAALKMKTGDYGALPIGENDRLIGMITDRDIVVRGVAEGRDPLSTTVRQVMSPQILYCFDDQTLDEVAKNMGDNQVRRLPVLNRQKRMVGILSLGDLAAPQEDQASIGEALAQISETIYRDQPRGSRATAKTLENSF